LLKIPSKKERENLNKNENIDSEFLEKILMDFGVSGNIKKISHGPVVTLNEFEPAAGVKVSKIINLSDDIARNTSSESARIATIPGSNTVGIELPNNSRENVYLSEILNHTDFKKKEVKLPIALGKSISGKPIVGDLSFYATSTYCWNYRIWKICLYKHNYTIFTLSTYPREM
jgi:S-DNA-T family DNA segregation ATPase FtsK/SpoIIIE